MKIKINLYPLLKLFLNLFKKNTKPPKIIKHTKIIKHKNLGKVNLNTNVKRSTIKYFLKNTKDINW